MSTLKVNKIRDNSGSTDAIVFDPNGGAVLAGVTTVSTVKVGSGVTISSDGDVFTTGITTSSSVIVGGGVTISESGIEASGIGITVANINGGAVSGRRNMIINGDQRVAQRGTTAKLTTTTATYKCVDRFKTDIDGSSGGDFFHAQTGTGTTISADVPTGQGFSHSSKITVNTSASQPTSESNHHQIYTMLEQQDVYHLEWGTSAAKTCTLSFWVKSSVAGTYALWFSIYTTSNTQYYWTNYTINSADTWEKKVITLTGPTSGGNLSGSLNGTGFRVEWTLGVGSDSETGTLNEWTTSSTFRTASGTVYLPENAGATWYLTGVQFEVGSQATAFEHRSFNEELLLCKRYYQKSYAYGTAPGTTNSFLNQIIGRAYAAVTNRMDLQDRFEVEMRATPTMTTFTPSGGTSGDVEDYASGNGTVAGTSRDVTAIRNLGKKGFGGISPSSAQDGVLGFHYTADAEL